MQSCTEKNARLLKPDKRVRWLTQRAGKEPLWASRAWEKTHIKVLGFKLGEMETMAGQNG